MIFAHAGWQKLTNTSLRVRCYECLNGNIQACFLLNALWRIRFEWLWACDLRCLC